ncbi:MULTISPECIES: LysR family transcriptional regulator [Burkholderia]|uniref:LysR family transcriptional regulator n=1 Tax=Burkholderia paludis TaxID=1506587 RepID=A0A6P2HA47_9BURK|nr:MULTISPECIES: LysR family transcriptional regulator [Burkholderia]CAB3750093.1 HTH-type transcriptional regulator PgrR [Burkholderia paludis]VWB13519.1 LysR family transcriptional regulator [Burkholderia paludis]
MDQLNGITVFVQVAEARSYVGAGQQLGLSASAVGKSIARLEKRLGVKLLHRSTRSMNLTAEGALYLTRCRHILAEAAAAETELLHALDAPRGKFRVSLPLVSGLMVPALTAFMQRYPEIELDVHFSDRLVDLIDEGFDAAVRTGTLDDSRLMSRQLGEFRLVLVGAPGYFARKGVPQRPADLRGHDCLQHRFPTTGMIQKWPLSDDPPDASLPLPARMICNNVETLLQVAKAGQGIACLPDFAVRDAIAAHELQIVLDAYMRHSSAFRVLWPSSKHPSPKLRAFVDFLHENLFTMQTQAHAARADANAEQVTPLA